MATSRAGTTRSPARTSSRPEQRAGGPPEARPPRIARPYIKDYGIPTVRKGLLAWRPVGRAIRTAPRYWIGTTDADGRPHLIQQWGAWVDGRLYWEGGSETRWAKNLMRDPRVAVAIERGGLAIMIEGEMTWRHPDAALGAAIITEYAAKPYDYVPTSDNWSGHGVAELAPMTVFAWKFKAFGPSATRFTFERPAPAK